MHRQALQQLFQKGCMDDSTLMDESGFINFCKTYHVVPELLPRLHAIRHFQRTRQVTIFARDSLYPTANSARPVTNGIDFDGFLSCLAGIAFSLFSLPAYQEYCSNTG